LLGSYWDRFRDLIIKGEIETRIEIDTKILKKSVVIKKESTTNSLIRTYGNIIKESRKVT